MAATRGRATWSTRLSWCLAVTVVALAVPSVALAAPVAPGVRDATVYQGGIGVTIWWTASTDTDAGSIQYQVYRDDVPMTIATYLANGELVLSTSNTTETVTPKADELAKKFTYYYMVVATNTTTGNKAVSSNIVPNVHGGVRSGYTTYNCQLCHSVHGAPPEGYLGAASTWGCYRCHGNTDATKSYGDKAVRNVQRDFYDYTSGQTIPTTVSRHYNQYMIDNETECTTCHTPHKSPYYVDPATGTKLNASSYTQLLRAEISDASYYYSTDAAPSGNAFCLQCHGSGTTALDFNAGTGAYDRTAGDHTYGASAAHNTSGVYANADGHQTNPGIQCEACHNKHASAADKLIAYRGDDSSATSADGTYAQAELCYACHSASGYAAEIAAGTSTGNTNFAWNGRDVAAQFGKASHHPTAAGSLTCANCHNVHSVQKGAAGTVWQLVRASLPDNTKTTYAGTATAFCLECHDGTAPTTAANTATVLVPYDVAFSDQSASPYFLTWNKSAIGADSTLGFTSSGHYTVSAANGQATCAACHDPHASNFPRLTAWTMPTGATGLNAGARENDAADAPSSQEQNLCYQCHGNGTTSLGSGVTSRRATGAKDVITKAILANSHNPADTTGVHSDLEDASDISAAMHAECTDCHDPHVTKKISSSAVHDTAWPGTNSSGPGSAVFGAWGVVPLYGDAVRDITQTTPTIITNPGTYNWTSPAVYTPLRLTGATTDTEAYLCFKCHSANVTALPAGTTDIAMEFNPSNFSVHNVLGQSVGMQNAFTVNGTSYTWTTPPAADFLKTGWTTNSMMTCTDCHTNDQNSATQAKGPHGSSTNWIIDPAYPTNWRTTSLSSTASGMSNTTNICAKCHTNLDACNDTHPSHATGAQGQCNYCHAGVPHGWKRPRLLAYTNEGTYASTRLYAVELRSYTYSNWSSSRCDTGCTHDNTFANTW